jgi:hypothetical protein
MIFREAPVQQNTAITKAYAKIVYDGASVIPAKAGT